MRLQSTAVYQTACCSGKPHSLIHSFPLPYNMITKLIACLHLFVEPRSVQAAYCMRDNDTREYVVGCAATNKQ